MANPRRLFPAAAFGLLAMLAWWAFDEQRPVQQQSEKSQPAYYFRDFELHVTRSEDGGTDYDLRGKHMIHYQRTDVSLIEQPVWTVYMPAGAPWHGRSDSGRATAGGSKVRLNGNVQLHRPPTSVNPAITLETQRLYLRPREDYADTDMPVTIYSRDFRVNATGARAWMREQRVQLLAEVNGHYEPSSP